MLPLRNVCERWSQLIDDNFEMNLYKRNIQKGLNWIEKQEFQELFHHIKQAMEWLKVNVSLFQHLPGLPTVLYADREFLEYAYAYIFNDILPKNPNIDESLMSEWYRDMVERINDRMCFEFLSLTDMELFLNNLNDLNINVGAILRQL